MEAHLGVTRRAIFGGSDSCQSRGVGVGVLWRTRAVSTSFDGRCGGCAGDAGLEANRGTSMPGAQLVAQALDGGA